MLNSCLTYIAPYWRRLTLVVALSLLGTILSLYVPYLSKGLVDQALLGHNWTALLRTVAMFAALTVTTPGRRRAAAVSTARITACAAVLRRIAR